NTATFDSIDAVVDTSFPEGQTFAAWLRKVGALPASNTLTILAAREDLLAAAPPAQRFLYAPSDGFVLQYGFFTPVGQGASQQCGRVVFSDFHVTGASSLSSGTTFPSECDPGPLSAQERALEFMLFDLASCVPVQQRQCTPRTCSDQSIGCGPAGDGCGGQLN